MIFYTVYYIINEKRRQKFYTPEGWQALLDALDSVNILSLYLDFYFFFKL